MFEGDDDFSLDDGPHSSRSTLFIHPDASFRPIRAVAKKRKFPGPAGLLHSDLKDLNVKAENKSDDFVLLSQDPSHHFVGNAWKTMLQELGPHRRILDEFNIRYIQENAHKRRMEKIPVLIAVLVRVATANCTLRDPTGEIEAVIDEKVYEESLEEFVPGAVIVLRDIAVLTGRKLYLIVTPKNLLTIYSEQTKITEGNADLGVRITRDNNLDFASILNSIPPNSECRNLLSSNAANLDYRNLQSSNVGNLNNRNLESSNVGNLDNRNLQSNNLQFNNVANLVSRNLQSSSRVANLDSRNLQFKNVGNLGNRNLQSRNKISKSTNIFESGSFEDLNDDFCIGSQLTENSFKFPDLEFTPQSQEKLENPILPLGKNQVGGHKQFMLRNQARQQAGQCDGRFKQENSANWWKAPEISASQISFTALRNEHSQILQEVFEGVPFDSFDEEF